MKAIITIMLIMLSMSGFCQREYTYENKGVNVFLEAVGSANRHYALGGPALSIGYQINPYFFIGLGVSNKFGEERSGNFEETRPLGWYDAKNDTYHNDYYINEKGERCSIVENPNRDGNYFFYNECCDDDGFVLDFDVALDVYVDIRYNFLAHSRYTPYLNLKSGGYFADDRSNFDELILGCRFGCGEGDFAITFGAGWNYRRIKDAESKAKHAFTLSLGVEF